jgi:archaellum component FlaC
MDKNTVDVFFLKAASLSFKNACSDIIEVSVEISSDLPLHAMVQNNAPTLDDMRQMLVCVKIAMSFNDFKDHNLPETKLNKVKESIEKYLMCYDGIGNDLSEIIHSRISHQIEWQ